MSVKNLDSIRIDIPDQLDSSLGLQEPDFRCAITLSRSRKWVVLAPCYHKFSLQGVLPWLKEKARRTCPICRAHVFQILDSKKLGKLTQAYYALKRIEERNPEDGDAKTEYDNDVDYFNNEMIKNFDDNNIRHRRPERGTVALEWEYWTAGRIRVLNFWSSTPYQIMKIVGIAAMLAIAWESYLGYFAREELKFSWQYGALLGAAAGLAGSILMISVGVDIPVPED